MKKGFSVYLKALPDEVEYTSMSLRLGVIADRAQTFFGLFWRLHETQRLTGFPTSITQETKRTKNTKSKNQGSMTGNQGGNAWAGSQSMELNRDGARSLRQAAWGLNRG